MLKYVLLGGLLSAMCLHALGQSDNTRLDSAYSYEYSSLVDSIPVRKNICTYSSYENSADCYNFSSCISSQLVRPSRTWTPTLKTETRKENQGQKIIEINYRWNSKKQTWNPTRKNLTLKVTEREKWDEYYWDTLSVSWIHLEDRLSKYDEQGRRIFASTKTFNREEEAWFGSEESNAFDSEGRVISYTFANWEATLETWLPREHYTRSYTSSGKLEEQVNFLWSEEEEDWRLSETQTYSYNSNDQLIYLLNQSGVSKRIDEYTYNDEGLEVYWQRSYQPSLIYPLTVEEKRESTYDLVGNLLGYEYARWNPDSLTWDLKTRQENAYNDLDQLVERKTYTWSGQFGELRLKEEEFFSYADNAEYAEQVEIIFEETGEINRGRKTQFEYDAEGRRIVRIVVRWDKEKNDWVNERRNENPYGPTGRVKHYAWYTWDILSETWKHGGIYGYTYNEDQLPSRFFTGFWRSQQNDWFTTLSTVYMYGPCKKENLVPADEGFFHLYPNPLSESSIFLEFAEEGPFEYQVMDLQGREILSGKDEKILNFLDMSSLVNGVYIIRCTFGDESATKKFVIRRP